MAGQLLQLSALVRWQTVAGRALNCVAAPALVRSARHRGVGGASIPPAAAARMQAPLSYTNHIGYELAHDQLRRAFPLLPPDRRIRLQD
jgi:hypothetical protein